MTVDVMNWTDQGHDFRVPMARRGQGPTVLMLPALSSISTLEEMAPLADRLAERFATIRLDWPGFGATDSPPVAWTPPALASYLDHVLDTVALRPFATVAAGHAAAYLLDAARRRPGSAGRLILIAPTWRGPLPTMMGRRSSLGARLAAIGDIPGLGAILYRLNVNSFTVKLMTKEHVYDSPAWLDAPRLAGKMAVTRSRGARHAALRFVTGELDPMDSRDAFLATARAVRDPILLIYGDASPRKSKAEMDQLADLPGIEVRRLAKGKLSIHEEEPDAVFEAMRPFLGR